MRSGKHRRPVTDLFKRVVLARRWLTFVTMCLSFAVFGVGTVNLFNVFRANVDLIASNGVMALADGAAQQLVELLLTLMLCMLAYVVFKTCEYRLVHLLSDTHSEDDVP